MAEESYGQRAGQSLSHTKPSIGREQMRTRDRRPATAVKAKVASNWDQRPAKEQPQIPISLASIQLGGGANESRPIQVYSQVNLAASHQRNGEQ